MYKIIKKENNNEQEVGEVVSLLGVVAKVRQLSGEYELNMEDTEANNDVGFFFKIIK